MKSIIHKATLSTITVVTELTLPASTNILSLQNQNDIITVWYSFEKHDRLEKIFRFRIVNTGQEFDNFFGIYLGTVILCNGDLVKHVYCI